MSTIEREPIGWLYPEIDAYRTGRLKVSDVHELYFEESGNPKGRPVVVLHGGPGGGSDPKLRRFFNPDRYRIIIFDQRGSGKSTPAASLVDNTVWHLVSDIERLRAELGIEKWHVFGGSWGSTLALAYAETHPERVTALFLRGIFLLRKLEIQWFYQEGAHMIFPDAWEDYLEPIPPAERGDLVTAYYRRLTSDDEAVRMEAARAWTLWEGRTSKLIADPAFIERYARDEFALAFARIECHYFINGGFFKRDGQLLEDVHRIRKIPAVIIQGRYDIPCPMASAWALHRSWPEAEFLVVPDAGHSMGESGISKALVAATDRMA